ncbi:MAG: hypothetical protein A3K03_13515 [Bdellovibrionales bacterium RIFOXYD1_FULL_44_7]|nr:MAG: hypothetical protein A3K03_13515 [Bdellovibrionales bacterium RIFOXYD1_FULL_44_7]
MTLLQKAVEEKKFDSRIVERNVERGVLRAEDVNQFTNDLPDETENADWVTLESLINDDSGKDTIGRQVPDDYKVTSPGDQDAENDDAY